MRQKPDEKLGRGAEKHRPDTTQNLFSGSQAAKPRETGTGTPTSQEPKSLGHPVLPDRPTRPKK